MGNFRHTKRIKWLPLVLDVEQTITQATDTTQVQVVFIMTSWAP